MTMTGDSTPTERTLTLLSVVAPMYDEEDTAERFYGRVRDALEGHSWELLLIDDGSADRTAEILASIATSDPRVKVITLSRNFGHQSALTAGLEHATGDAVCMIDSDLQDPPELVPEMVDAWRKGIDVVYAVRRAREGETRFKLTSAHWFYRLLSRLAQVDIPVDSGDFRLMDRRALDALLSMRERNRFLRGMTVWVGFTQSAVEYDRGGRAAGKTKYTLRRMLGFAADALVSFSNVPLQIATLLGFLFSALAFLLIPVVIAARLADVFVPGISSTLVIVLLLGGIQLITIGIIGEYVGRIYDEVKRRPLYVVRSRRNVSDDTSLPPDEHRVAEPQGRRTGH
jgi:dolichol-phosphate mannosyltransferase